MRFWPLWHRGSRRRASAATKLQDNGFFGSLKQSRAAELGRAADPPRVPRDQNGRGSMYSHQDHKTPALARPGDTGHKSATVASHGRSSFPRGYPLPRRSLERYAALGLSQGWCSLHTAPPIFTVLTVQYQLTPLPSLPPNSLFATSSIVLPRRPGGNRPPCTWPCAARHPLRLHGRVPAFTLSA